MAAASIASLVIWSGTAPVRVILSAETFTPIGPPGAAGEVGAALELGVPALPEVKLTWRTPSTPSTALRAASSLSAATPEISASRPVKLTCPPVPAASRAACALGVRSFSMLPCCAAAATAATTKGTAISERINRNHGVRLDSVLAGIFAPGRQGPITRLGDLSTCADELVPTGSTCEVLAGVD